MVSKLDDELLMPEPEVYSIAIVGAGFSGTATAVHLLREATHRPMRILLVEREPEVGRGVAYRAYKYPFLLNVPASRMSAISSEPDDFLRFARRTNGVVSGQDFLPRSVYGDYLQDLLETATRSAISDSRLQTVHGHVVDIVGLASRDSPVELKLGDGSRILANHVALASGNPPATLPRAIRDVRGIPGLNLDPWRRSPRTAGWGPLLVFGTGLTMADVVCEAVDRHPDRPIYALSRHGLVPPNQTAFRPDALEDAGPALIAAGGSLAQIVATTRSLAHDAERRGGDWREAVTALRQVAPTIWRILPTRERRRFLRHVRAYWDIHRHRLPGPVLSRIERLRSSGQLTVYAGQVVGLQAHGTGLRLTWRPRRTDQVKVLDVAEAINCTGPDYDLTRTADPLWSSLLVQGAACADELSLGVRTGAHGALIGRDGHASQRLFYVGPMLRAEYWEATAVGELRLHAEEVARHLAAQHRREKC